MKKFTKQLETKASVVKLSALERKELRERVVSYMEYHPLAITKVAPKVVKQPLLAEPFKVVHFNFMKGRILQWGGVTAALLMVVTPVLAERAIPGDVLYAVKVQINEPVRSTLAFSPYQKVEWETELLNRRLAEARVLAREGKLNGEVEVAIATAVKEHSENAKREIEELRESDAEEAALATIAFNTTLEVQSASLREEGALLATAEGAGTVTLLETVINETLTQQASEESNTTILSLERLMARVEENTTRVYQLLESVTLIDAETHQDVNRRLQDIERTVQEGLDLREGGDAASAPLLIDALERSQRLIVFLSELQVGQSAKVEKYVPVVLTPEEKQNFIEQSEKTLAEQRAFITSNSLLVTDAETVEKMQYALTTMASLKESLETKATFAEVQATYEEALAVGRDTIEFYRSLNIETDSSTSTPAIPEDTASTTDPLLDIDVEISTSTQLEIEV